MQTDLLIVGGGAAGLVAAVAARRLGLATLVIEAADSLGGSTAGSDGQLWLPGSQLGARAGSAPDAVDEAIRYLESIPGAQATDALRRGAFARTAGAVARWLASSKISLEVVRGVPDYYSELPGGTAQGRTLRARSADTRLPAEWAQRLRPLTAEPARDGALGRLIRPWRTTPPAGGDALIRELLQRAVGTGVEIWANTTVTSLVVEQGRVSGVVVSRDGDEQQVRASAGVVLASGGFEADQTARDEHLPRPTSATWTVGGGNDGTALRLGREVGAATTGLDLTWGVPVLLAAGEAHPVDRARSAPHALIVDAAGDRFFNESEPPGSAARRLYDHNQGMRSVPSFLIMDNRHRKAQPLGPWEPGASAKAAIEAGELAKAASLNELAEAIGVDRAGLLGSVVAFNQLVRRGKDTDFGRGETAWDTHLGDPLLRRNPNLGGVDRSPFWAVRIYPGDAGTAGGLAVDDRSRVVREDGSVVAGLFACAGAAASPFGPSQPGPGAALAAAVVDAYRAALEVAGALDRFEAALG